jgi:hypothetical protein
MLDIPRRVVLELAPVKLISYDGTKLADAITREGVTGRPGKARRDAALRGTCGEQLVLTPSHRGLICEPTLR